MNSSNATNGSHNASASLLFFGGYTLNMTNSNEVVACIVQPIVVDDTFWRSVNPMLSTLPFFVIQVSLMIVLIRFLFLGFKLAYQPRFLAELVAAIMIGPVMFGQSEVFSKYVHPLNTTQSSETLGNLGLVYYMFLVGLEMDLSTIKRIGKKALMNAIASIVTSIAAGIGMHYVIWDKEHVKGAGSAIFWAMTLTVTSFPDLARILSDIKILHTDIGRTALSSSIITDLVSWILLVGATSYVNGHHILFVLPTLGFLLFCWFALRPVVSWVIHQTTPKGGYYTDLHLFSILTGVLICGFISDACGAYSMIGAFMFGIVIPNGDLAMKLIEKLEDFVTGIMLPAFFLIIGIKTTLYDMTKNTSVLKLVIGIAMACLAKIASAFFVTMFHGMSAREGIALGFLMNTKGVLALIILNVGRNLQVLDNHGFSVMMVVIVIMTIFVKPIPNWIYKTRKQLKRYKRRTIERSKPDSELRILTCIHATRNLTSMISLLELTHSTKQSPLCIFAVHLVELKGRSSAMLIVHDTHRKPDGQSNTRQRLESDQIISALQSYESRSQSISIQPLTAVSPYATMHEDVCSLAEEKRVTLILSPFHKQVGTDGSLHGDNPSVRLVNQNLLLTAPCSVGIFIDRGLTLELGDDFSSPEKIGFRFAMVFIGGADDREALAYACRVAGTRDVSLTIIRFLSPRDANYLTTTTSDDGTDDASQGILTQLSEGETEKQIDDEYINEFRFRTMCDQSITYLEKPVNTGDEIIGTMRNLFHDFDMYILGRRKDVVSPLTSGLSEWSECDELGPLGDALSASDFAQHASILVLQQSSTRFTPTPTPTTMTNASR